VRSRGIGTRGDRFTPARGLTLGANGSFNDVSYLRYTNAPCPPERAATSCDLSGPPRAGQRAALDRQPGRAVCARRRRWPGEGYLNANYAYRSGTYGTLDASEYSRIPAYSLTNLSAGVRCRRRGKWDVSVWAKNAFDKQYYTSMWNSSFGSYNAVIGTPRTVGVTAADF
jgi:iron complex outermembrane receptor protein